jgi:hypothetical protein
VSSRLDTVQPVGRFFRAQFRQPREIIEFDQLARSLLLSRS